jgi:XTP/dITP diphosphohydrolase
VIQLLIATTNQGKLAELRALLASGDHELTDLGALGLDLGVEEDGPDYDAIALKKAVTYARAAGLWALADDTGLEVDALGGAPGLRTARLSHDDRSRRARLLESLADRPRPWTALFRCSVALADPQGKSIIGRGACDGEIIPEERGREGFGYDPIFLVAAAGLTLAELPLGQKNRISHRARAVQDLIRHVAAGALPEVPFSFSAAG